MLKSGLAAAARRIATFLLLFVAAMGGQAAQAAPVVYIGLSAGSFSPRSAPDLRYTKKLGSAIYLMQDDHVRHCFGAGVDIPDHVVIRALRVYLESTDESDLSVSLERKDAAVGDFLEVFSGTIANDANLYNRVSIPITKYNVVDTNRYLYTLNVCIAEGTSFHGAQVGYTLK